MICDDDGDVNYFRNDGSVASASFTAVTGTAHPFDGVSTGDDAFPVLADLDGDGDLDAYLGHGGGGIYSLRNDGSATSASFTAVTGTANPFDGLEIWRGCRQCEDE